MTHIHFINKNIGLLFENVSTFLPSEDVITNQIQRYAYGTDASFYRLTPQLILRLSTEQQLQKVLLLATEYNIAVTFRAAGTSLSGQAITDSVLIILNDNWRGIDICPSTFNIRLQPNVIGAQANRALAKYNRIIGPDPASINSCKIGGIAANNSSGMCCGVKHNSYHTMENIRLVFADGAVLDTSDEQSKHDFRLKYQDKLTQLNTLAQQIKTNPVLLKKVQHKYRLKNTTGYGINALIDYEDPIEMLSHLMIGSEGTLAFISDITYRTIAVHPFKATGLYIFDDIVVASQLVEQLAKYNVDAVEIMDSRALLSVEDKLSGLITNNTDDFSEQNRFNNSTGLLIEISANSLEALQQLQRKISDLITEQKKHVLPSCEFTSDMEVIQQLWAVRKGMFPAVGANRQLGTTVIIEDIAVPLPLLSKGITDLQNLLMEYGYHDAIIFGHALSGNLHFVFSQGFSSEEEVKRYQRFMEVMCSLITNEYQGSLKAEHGTGRNMAPFVEMEWGTDLYQIMKSLKSIFDPNNILNPGVIINDDKQAHLKNLKSMPEADEVLDKCIECGFCEVVCPSKELTLTPRQRIAVWRRISQLQQQPVKTKIEQKELQEMEADYQYFGIDSCAATGLCAQKCPVGIDTGQFVKNIRAKKFKNNTIVQTAATHFSTLSKVARVGLNLTHYTSKTLGHSNTKKSFKLLNKITNNRIPLWYPSWPKSQKIVNDESCQQKPAFDSKLVYFSSCANRIFASDSKADDQRSIHQVLVSLCNKANIELVTPKSIDSLCCGMPWQSKGAEKQKTIKQTEAVLALKQASEDGKWPVIVDASPCTLKLNNQTSLNLYDVVEFAVKFLVPRLTITASEDSYVLHNTCSSQKMDGGKYLIELAHLCSNNIFIPEDIYCCGFAGDKGFFNPELNENALKDLKKQIPQNCKGGISNSRTCEIGLSKNSGVAYQSILYLLDKVSK